MSDNRSLLDIAVMNFNVACELHQNKTDDPIRLNIIGYHLQQAAELALKHILEMEGKNYPRTHDIGDLIGLLNYPEALSDMELLSAKITEMEAKTRYDKDFSANIRIVEKLFPMIGQFLEHTIENDKNTFQTPEKLFCEKHSGNDIQNESIREDWQKYLPQVTGIVMKIATERSREEAFIQEMRKRLRENHSDEAINQALNEGLGGNAQSDDAPPLPPR